MGSVLYLDPHARRATMARAGHMPAASEARSLLRLGYNCCAIARAGRVALMVDAESYFRAFYQSALKAQRSITVLAWDFNSQTRLHFDPVPRDGPPTQLGEFLNYLVRRRHGLHVHVLNWDYPMVFGADREFPPLYGFGWSPERRVHLRYDDTHPIAGCQHQKVVVIDDAIAFVGGIDLTVRRWDTPAHRPGDPRRMAYGKPYPPFHDLMMLVDGDAARALASLARERWRLATGRRLRPVTRESDPWPDGLAPELTDVDIGLARTLPPRGEVPAVREVENLYLDMIAAARRRIYIENQYFTAPRIAAALEERLAEPDGPEIVLVLRLLSHGWLEEHTMHVLRTRLLRRLQAADRHGRFCAYYPHVAGLPSDSCIDMHSKLMIVDDEILRIGSANLCNRSMAVDAECDAVLEADGDAGTSAAIRGFRDRLLAEHLGSTPQAVATKLAQKGSLHATIAAFAGRERCLRAVKEVAAWPEAVVSVAAVADPDEPIAFETLVAERALEEQQSGSGPAWGKLALAAAAIAGLAALWRYTPLAQWISADAVIGWAQALAVSWWAPLALIAAYTPACFVMFPRPLLTLAGVIAFGPWQGFAYALTGVTLAAAVTYLAGLQMRRDTVRRLAGRRLDRMVDVLGRNGLLAMVLLRLVPVAPFAVPGFVAGALRLKLWHLLAGTAIGHVPGTLLTTVFGDQLEGALSGSGGINWWIVGGLAALLGAGILAVRRWFNRMARRIAADAAGRKPR